jgi:hypothetical protein
MDQVTSLLTPAAMLNEFWEFDRKMIHEKYISLIESFENK